MGWHFINPKVTGFDVRSRRSSSTTSAAPSGSSVAFEWVFPAKPAKPPLPGATYGSFGAACHYKDGTFVFKATPGRVRLESPQTGAAFGSGTRLVTLHVWLWYPNPNGLFAGMNPLMHPFNAG